MDIKNDKPIRVLLAKWAYDGHDAGVRVVANMLKDAGMEVIYIVFNTVQEVADAALQEDVNMIGLSAFVGDTPKVFAADLLSLLKAREMGDVPVIVGGRVTKQDIPDILKSGVAATFGPGTSRTEILDFVNKRIKQEGVKK